MQIHKNITEQIVEAAESIGFLRIAIAAAQDLPRGDAALKIGLQATTTAK